MRVAVAAAAVVAGLACLAPTAPATSADEPNAFQRPPRAGDRLPDPYRFGEVTDSRRVARLVVRRPTGTNTVSLYVAKRRGGWLCVVIVDRGSGGGGCSPRDRFLGPGNRIAAISGRLFAGIVGNEVRRVVVIGSRGVRHPVRPTSDGGFIWDCRAWNGCTCVLAAVEAYDGSGRLVERERWPGASCGSRRR